MSKAHRIIPIFVPHKGCPFDCVFCNQKKITGLSTDTTPNDVKEIIDNYLDTIPKTNKELEVAFYGGSFTAIDGRIQKELLEVAYSYKKKGYIDSIRLSTRPDFIDDERLMNLSKRGVDIIELGVQSMDDRVLALSHRGHSSKDVREAVEKIKSFNFRLGLQMMLGLPGDDKEKSLATAQKIISLAPDFVRIYPTLVVKDTYLEKLLLENRYVPLTLEDTVELGSDLLMLYSYHKIPVIRMGLQPTENITYNSEVVGGPFHPALRQLIEANIYKKILLKCLGGKNVRNKSITIIINEKEISNLVGQKRENLNDLKSHFDIKEIKVMGSSIAVDAFIVQIEGIQMKVERDFYIRDYLLKRNLIKEGEY